jgi:hypothetical protein
MGKGRKPGGVGRNWCGAKLVSVHHFASGNDELTPIVPPEMMN